ncbi:Outer membrane protein beta-barrel domain-containing protein [Pseudarcicella hirudinis]|uniref:Outer membrane protein beta-barrel domain-containing protein n=1 Tax=Pseudarcicella hirudinis TaxID=1079859 RepID=A0A1I5NYI0_9BACT|nr:outer membrane beta-barrel protein [Pseudarcicella hirudinis]SFP26825.1 Outer membrane protein beta-barrel domain-containing protein [Pseudarcicella hirudinis]
MKKVFVLLLFILIKVSVYAQITFEEGYFISNNGNKINCQIKNKDWLSNPIDFKYKLSQNSEVKTIGIDSVKEFGIGNTLKYIRKTVEMDNSTENIRNLTYDRNPSFQSETVFLKVLIEGKANLYYYEGKGFRRFFYSKDGLNTVRPLIYKLFLTTGNSINKNLSYRQELLDSLPCERLTFVKVQNLDYSQSDLEYYVNNFNNCDGAVVIKKVKNKVAFNLSVRAGLNLGDMEYTNNYSKGSFYNNLIGYRIGLEAEIKLPFNKQKWALFIEPSFHSLKQTKESQNLSVDVNYQSIEIPLGIRHYFFLNQNIKMNANIGYVFDFPQKSSSIVFNGSNVFDSLYPNPSNPFAGLGINYRDKLSFELRYNYSRSLLLNLNSGIIYNYLSFIVGYKLF